MTRILFMSEEEARTTLYCAGLSGEYEILVTGNIEKNQTIQHHPYCHKFIDLKNELELTENTQPLVDELLEIIKSESVDLLLPVSITCMNIIDKHKDQIRKHVPITSIPTKEAVDLLDNKYNFYLFCQELGIAHPLSVLAEKASDIEPEDPGVPYPLLIKPLLGVGGFETLAYIETKEEMMKFLSEPEDKTSKYFPALVQEFFEGEDIDMNGFSQDGKVIASSVMRTDFYEKDRNLSFTYFVEDDAVIKLGTKILDAAKFSGPTNVDMRIRASDGTLMLIEVNPRYWARVHVSLMDGMNFLDIGIRAALGRPYQAKSKCPSKYWVSSISPLIKAVLKNKDFGYLKYFFLLSWAEIRFLVFNKIFRKMAAKKLKTVV